MPDAPLKVCRWPGCHELTRDRSGYCPAHQDRAEESRKQHARLWSRERGNTTLRGYGRDWQTLRESFLRDHPLCAHCLAQGVIRPATVVHHIQPVEQRPDLRLNPDNLEALCRNCHELEHGRKHQTPGEGQKFK